MNVTLTHPISNFTGNVNFQDGAVILGFTAGTCAVDLDPKFFNAVASYGILITIGTPGVSPAYDANFDVVTAAITAAAGSQTTGVLRSALVPFWAASETVTTGTVRMDSSGRTITRNSNGTTRSTYDATEQALWTVASGGGGGGGVTSVNGHTGVVTLAAADVSADAAGAATTALATAKAFAVAMGVAL